MSLTVKERADRAWKEMMISGSSSAYNFLLQEIHSAIEDEKKRCVKIVNELAGYSLLAAEIVGKIRLTSETAEACPRCGSRTYEETTESRLDEWSQRRCCTRCRTEWQVRVT